MSLVWLGAQVLDAKVASSGESHEIASAEGTERAMMLKWKGMNVRTEKLTK